MVKDPKVCIIILNWNGWRDTIECLESIQQLEYSNYLAVVVDNASTNDSLRQIQTWAAGENPVTSRYVDYQWKNKPVQVILNDQFCIDKGSLAEAGHRWANEDPSRRLILIENTSNLGFAAGSNVGISYALAIGADYIWLLNNDTVLAPNALSHLVSFLESNSQYHGVTGQIRFYHTPNIIWNCGGDLTWYGNRKYHYLNKHLASVPQRGHRRLSYITNCAALFRSSLFLNIGLLTNRFFFGEEDIEFSIRLRKQGYSLACCYEAIIYHKVNSSLNLKFTKAPPNRAYIHYLNRFIHVRSYLPSLVWHFWRMVWLCYVVPRLKTQYKLSWAEIIAFSKALFQDSSTLDGVSREKFEEVMDKNFNFR